MRETTVALPEEPEGRPDAEPPKRSRELPVFDSGRPLAPHEMDASVYEHNKKRAARR
ncbi:CopG family transcriptional regulator [Streptomyces cyaneofuscatus]|uniref:CopG family transcriptional regulator n=1 Tax=Streptomyces TaxID=1883 RepID=UPI000D13020B|nr:MULTISPECIES: CopG family transcriptional regulator [Streptomyces]CAD5961169.1 CopG family transcriptional regulator [Streptomyces sp. KY70]CAD5980075.1 CopG family transcriptional regulator [Streptomyces sp. KY75]